MEPILDRPRAVSAARAHLDRGFRLEQGGTLDRSLEAYTEALALAATPAEEVDARLRIARVYRTLSEYEKSVAAAREAVRLALEIGADDLAAEAMNVEVGALQMRGAFEEAHELALRAFDLARSPRVRGITLQNLGRGAAERGDFETSDRYFAESVAAFRAADYDLGVMVALANAARAALDRGDAARALETGNEAIALARRLNSLDVLLTAVQNQAAAFVAMGNLEAAEGLLTEALGHFTSAKNPGRQAECLEIMGQMCELRPDPETAVRCYTRARDLAIVASDRVLIERLTRRMEFITSQSAGTNGAL